MTMTSEDSGAAPAEPAPEGSLGFGWRVLCSVGLGIACALCFPPHAAPVLLPFALTGLFALLPGMTPRRAAYIGQGFGTVCAALALRWLWGMFGPAAVSLWALIGAFTAVACSLMVWLRGRLPRVPFPLLAAFAWVGIEYFRSEPMALNFAWLGAGYPLVGYALPGRIAAVVGSYGLSFLVVGGCAYAATGKRFPAVALRLAPLALLFAPFPTTPPSLTPTTTLSIRLVQANSEDDESLFRLSQSPAASPPALIVWPEYSYVSDPRGNPKLWKQLQELPRRNRSYFLFGAKDQFDPKDDDRFRNTAFLLAPDGNVVGRHVKNHTVHFIKDGVAGTDADVFPTPFGVLGVGICFDMDYPDVARRLVDNGAEVLIVPSDNPLEWGPVQHAQHKQLFQMRAAECDRWLATADVAGNTFLVSPSGRILRSVRTADPTYLDVKAGRLRSRTLFVRGGWRFGQFCLMLLTLGFCWAAFARLEPRFSRLDD